MAQVSRKKGQVFLTVNRLALSSVSNCLNLAEMPAYLVRFISYSSAFVVKRLLASALCASSEFSSKRALHKKGASLQNATSNTKLHLKIGTLRVKLLQISFTIVTCF